MRSSNEAVWGGSFEDLNDPKREIRASRIKTLATLADHHTLFRNKNTHARLCCQAEKWTERNNNRALHTYKCVRIFNKDSGEK